MTENGFSYGVSLWIAVEKIFYKKFRDRKWALCYNNHR